MLCTLITKGTVISMEINTDAEALRFYKSSAWQRKRQEVLALDRYECQRCKARGKYNKATIVHHVKHLKDRPDLALSIYDGEERQLVSLCKSCHEDEHPEAQMQNKNKFVKPLTDERWD